MNKTIHFTLLTGLMLTSITAIDAAPAKAKTPTTTKVAKKISSKKKSKQKKSSSKRRQKRNHSSKNGISKSTRAKDKLKTGLVMATLPFWLPIVMVKCRKNSKGAFGPMGGG